MSYKQKYLKYKLKYLTIKKLYGGMNTIEDDLGYPPVSPPSKPSYNQSLQRLTSLGWDKKWHQSLMKAFPNNDYPKFDAHKHPTEPTIWSDETIQRYKEEVKSHERQIWLLADDDVIQNIIAGLVSQDSAIGKVLTKVQEKIIDKGSDYTVGEKLNLKSE
jgi:hypothetical protein